MLRRLARCYSINARKKRAQLFLQYLNPTEDDKLLDLGGGDGGHISTIISFKKNVYIGDISPEKLSNAINTNGFGNTVLLKVNQSIKFPDKFFDIIFCSSVIEHVTGSKEEIYRYNTNKRFAQVAFERQKNFAKEIQRIGQRYFVQTPYRYFPIESHTCLPVIIVLLPRKIQVSIIGFFNKWWPKKTIPDWNLLTIREMKVLFPDATIVIEKSLGLPKSIMAIKC